MFKNSKTSDLKLPVMVKLSLVQFPLNPVEVALRPAERNGSGPRSSNFYYEDDTDGMES